MLVLGSTSPFGRGPDLIHRVAMSVSSLSYLAENSYSLRLADYVVQDQLISTIHRNEMRKVFSQTDLVSFVG